MASTKVDFNSRFRYQLALFFGQLPLEVASFQRAVRAFSPENAEAKRLRLRFGGAVNEQEVVAGPGVPMMPSPVMAWSGPFWKLRCRVDRIDIFFDAMLFREVEPGPLVGADVVVAAIQPALRDLPTELGVVVSRVALVADGEVTDHAAGSVVVAEGMVNPDLIERAKAGDLPDALYRVNRRETVALGGVPTPVNRLETRNASDEGRRLQWQYDVNTPYHQPANQLSSNHQSDFWAYAARDVSKALAEIESEVPK